MAGQLGPRGDHPVGPGVPGQEIHRYIPLGQSLHQVQVDQGQLAGPLHPVHQGGDVEHAPEEQEDHPALGGQGPLQPRLVLYRGHHGAVVQRIQKD